MNETVVSAASRSDVGREREHNEDCHALHVPTSPDVLARRGILAVVADGMGGHRAGEVASRMATDAVQAAYYATPGVDPLQALVSAIHQAADLIQRQAERRPDQRGMGTTCAAAVLLGEFLGVAHVGDSRVYLLRGGALHRLTQDHSWVEESMRAGVYRQEQADLFPNRNLLTQALGSVSGIKVASAKYQVQPGDLLLLCSDGLSGPVPDDAILSMLQQAKDPTTAAARLIEAANAAGGPDNITAMVLRIESIRPLRVSAPAEPAAPRATPAAAAPVPEPARPPVALGVVAALLALATLVVAVALATSGSFLPDGAGLLLVAGMSGLVLLLGLLYWRGVTRAHSHSARPAPPIPVQPAAADPSPLSRPTPPPGAPPASDTDLGFAAGNAELAYHYGSTDPEPVHQIRDYFQQVVGSWGLKAASDHGAPPDTAVLWMEDGEGQRREYALVPRAEENGRSATAGAVPTSTGTVVLLDTAMLRIWVTVAECATIAGPRGPAFESLDLYSEIRVK